MTWLTIWKIVLYTGGISLVMTAYSALRPRGPRWLGVYRTRRSFRLGWLVVVWLALWAFLAGLTAWVFQMMR